MARAMKLFHCACGYSSNSYHALMWHLTRREHSTAEHYVLPSRKDASWLPIC